MVKFLISRPIAVIMVFIAVLMLGIVSYRLLPVALMPNIDIPEITVQVNYPSSSARELENAVVKTLRSQLMQVTHLNDINSETTDGRSMIRLSFDYGTPVDYAFIEVNEKIDGAMNFLPRDMSRPRAIKASATDLPVFYLNVYIKPDTLSDNKDKSVDAPASRFLEMSDFCRNVISKRIEQLPEVAMVDMSGTTDAQIIIKPDKRKMESLHISPDMIQQAINNSNINPGSIMVRDGYYQYFIRLTSYLKKPEDIGNIYISTNNKVLQLKEIAEINIQPQKERGMFLTAGKRAISMAIIQQADAKMEDLKTSLNGLIKRFGRDYPDLGFEVAQDQSQLLDFSMSNLQQDLLFGGIMAFFMLFLFLNDFRAPVLIGITVPISLVISFLFFKVFHLSLNIISLAGLALGLGMIIDCSIIVIENILHYYGHHMSLKDACIKGTEEVIRPMLSSTLSTSAVFMPLIFISGTAGALFYDEAISVSLGNAASFIVSITILPVMFMLVYKFKWKNKKSLKESTFQKVINPRRWMNLLSKLTFGKKLEAKYEKGIDWVFQHKTLTTTMFFVLLLSNFLLFKIVKKEKLPAFNQTEVVINMDWNENIHIDESRRRIEELLGRFNHSIVQSNTYIGEQQFLLNRDKEQDYFQAGIYLKFNRAEQVTQFVDSFQLLMQQKHPMARFNYQPPENIFERIFTNNEPPLLAKVSVTNTGQYDPDSVISFVSKTDALLKTSIPNRIPLKQQLSLRIDLEKLLLYRVDYNTVYQTIKTAFNENQFATLHSYQQFMPILLGDEPKTVGEVLATRKVPGKKGDELPLSEFVTVSRIHDLKFITAGEQGEYIPLNYYVNAEQSKTYQNRIRDLVKGKKYPDVQFGGSLINNSKMFGQLSIILTISLLLLYFILAAQFESLLQPLIVLLEIPVDIAGALFLLWIFGSSLNIMSGIGIIIMTGVIINDSILKVDTINQFRKEGVPLMDAIKQGGTLRLGSILMTATTTIFAVLPFFFGNDMGSALQKPLSLALIGGMALGTVVSLFFVPLVYWWIYRNEKNEGIKKYRNERG